MLNAICSKKELTLSDYYKYLGFIAGKSINQGKLKFKWKE